MNLTCDLHTHSNYSDGTWSPAQLVRGAEKAGLSAIALCDHNTVAGLPSFLEAARGRKIEPVPGVEFSTDYCGTELHILGLFIQPQHYKEITELLNEMLIRKEQSNIALIEGLRKAGIFLDYEKIKAGTRNGQVNRAVIAGEMARLGYAASIQEAFELWLSPHCGYYQPPRRLDAFRVIRFIKSIGAAAVLAHPFLNLQEEALRGFLAQALEYGLDGMETIYPLFDEKTTVLAGKIAEEFGLKQSGGSDFHGENKPDIHLGTGKGNISVPISFLEKLKLGLV